MFKKPRQVLALSIPMLFSLMSAGCGGSAPSEAEIKTSVENQQAQDQKSAGSMAGLLPSVKVLKKIGCKEDGEKAYKCDVEVEVTQFDNTRASVAQLRFVKTSTGWQVSR